MNCSLATVAIAMGAVLLPVYAGGVIAPGAARKVLKAFPRNRIAALVLTAVALVWAARLLWLTPLGRLQFLRPWIVPATPVAYALVVAFMPELLSVRALGAIMLLLPAPILAVARWHESPWRLVVVVVAYLIAVKGIVLVLSPYKFRQGIERLAGSDAACRAWNALGVALAVALVVLGLAVY